VKFTVAGANVDLEPDSVVARLAGRDPEAIATHWVNIAGTRWPPKQVLEAATGISRSHFVSHRAISILRTMGFETSEIPPPDDAKQSPARRPSTATPDEAAVSLLRLHEAVDVLAAFIGAQELTSRIAMLEQQLLDATATTSERVAAEAGLSIETLSAALRIRNTLGRVSDIVHATVIALALPRLLGEGEVVSNRPSLAAENDPTRPFDLETNLRIAEFKVSVWKGADAMRKRGAFADLVHLALDDSGRRAQLFVVGDQPRKLLEGSRSPASWGFTRGSASLKQRFEARFGSVEIPISEVRRQHAGHVEIVDLNSVIPGLSALLD
jgi:hypothetical protein